MKIFFAKKKITNKKNFSHFLVFFFITFLYNFIFLHQNQIPNPSREKVRQKDGIGEFEECVGFT